MRRLVHRGISNHYMETHFNLKTLVGLIPYKAGKKIIVDILEKQEYSTHHDNEITELHQRRRNPTG